MISRQVGRRRRPAAAPRRKQPVSRRRNETALEPQERRHMVQLVACAAIFVLLVAAKLLLPSKMAVFNQKLSSAMEQNMDLQAVFSAVGRAFAGEGDPVSTADSIYQAVFHPEQPPLPVPESPVPEDLPSGAGLAALQACRSAGAAEPLPQPDASTLAYVLYSQENLPESASMEQAILGFDYCTPVQGTLTSDFGYREHPVEGEERFHYGIDLAADTGTEILCFADGTVTAVGESSSYGNYCIVAHEGGFSTLYAHCSRIVVTSGTALTRGQKLGEVGQTGAATGPHLHFELQQDGLYLNPIYYVSVL